MADGTGSTSLPRYTKYSSIHDAYRRYLTDSPTAASLSTTLRSIDDGDVAAMVEISEEIEAKDAHVQGVASRRRESVTALDWSIVPDTSTQDDEAAVEAAEYCQRELTNLRTWPDTLDHLATAIGPGVAVSELVWHRGRLVETVDVPGHRLTGNTSKGTGVFVLTDEHPTWGIKAVSPSFITYTPNARAGFPLRVTITRANAYLWLIKHFAVSDWTAFCEVYGQPIRVAKATEAPSSEARDAAIDMLKNMASDCWAFFPEGVEVEFLEAARTNQPYEGIIDWIERKQAILWLGQTLTTEPDSVGSLALGKVHDNVRASITLSDLQAEARMIRDQVLRPMVRLRWPGQLIAVPMFKRKIVGDTNLDERRARLDELRFAREVGLQLDPEWLYAELNIPAPRRTDESNTGQPQ